MAPKRAQTPRARTASRGQQNSSMPVDSDSSTRNRSPTRATSVVLESIETGSTPRRATRSTVTTADLFPALISDRASRTPARSTSRAERASLPPVVSRARDVQTPRAVSVIETIKEIQDNAVPARAAANAARVTALAESAAVTDTSDDENTSIYLYSDHEAEKEHHRKTPPVLPVPHVREYRSSPSRQLHEEMHRQRSEAPPPSATIPTLSHRRAGQNSMTDAAQNLRRSPSFQRLVAPMVPYESAPWSMNGPQVSVSPPRQHFFPSDMLQSNLPGNTVRKGILKSTIPSLPPPRTPSYDSGTLQARQGNGPSDASEELQSHRSVNSLTVDSPPSPHRRVTTSALKMLRTYLTRHVFQTCSAFLLALWYLQFETCSLLNPACEIHLWSLIVLMRLADEPMWTAGWLLGYFGFALTFVELVAGVFRVIQMTAVGMFDFVRSTKIGGSAFRPAVSGRRQNTPSSRDGHLSRSTVSTVILNALAALLDLITPCGIIVLTIWLTHQINGLLHSLSSTHSSDAPWGLLAALILANFLRHLISRSTGSTTTADSKRSTLNSNLHRGSPGLTPPQLQSQTQSSFKAHAQAHAHAYPLVQPTPTNPSTVRPHPPRSLRTTLLFLVLTPLLLLISPPTSTSLSLSTLPHDLALTLHSALHDLLICSPPQIPAAFSSAFRSRHAPARELRAALASDSARRADLHRSAAFFEYYDAAHVRDHARRHRYEYQHTPTPGEGRGMRPRVVTEFEPVRVTHTVTGWMTRVGTESARAGTAAWYDEWGREIREGPVEVYP